ncbi:hypothetical protein AX17_002742 [Amanita inopinata Kibby_2008]|nr:hypothetical protein AX17_002742 [Amanita inopinata Kibby_2008]
MCHPPLQDITHRFISPLPPSSPPLPLSNHDNEHDRPISSSFLQLSSPSARKALANRRLGRGDTSDKENDEALPTFDLGDEFDNERPQQPGPSNAVLPSPSSQDNNNEQGGLSPSPASSDPFGFLAVERKLKLERKQPKRDRRQLEREQKRQRYDPSPTTVARATATATTSATRIRTPLTTLRRTRPSTRAMDKTPVLRDKVNIEASSALRTSILHMQGKKRRRRTLVYDDENPFLDPHDTTPSPTKLLPSESAKSMVAGPALGLADTSRGEDLPAPLTPVLSGKSVLLDVPGTPPGKHRRKRARLSLETLGTEDVGNKTLSALADDPPALKRVLKSRLPRRRGGDENIDVTPVKKVKRARLRRKCNDSESEESDGGGGDGKKGLGKGKSAAGLAQRRSARLAGRDVENTGGQERDRNGKGKGKENLAREVKKRVRLRAGKAVATKERGGKSKDEVPLEEVTEVWERERAARKAYFEKLDSYELETENIYVI